MSITSRAATRFSAMVDMAGRFRSGEVGSGGFGVYAIERRAEIGGTGAVAHDQSYQFHPTENRMAYLA